MFCLGRQRLYPGVNHVVFLVAIQSAPCRLPRRGNRVIKFVAGSCEGSVLDLEYSRRAYLGSRDLFARVSRKLSRGTRNSK